MAVGPCCRPLLFKESLSLRREPTTRRKPEQHSPRGRTPCHPASRAIGPIGSRSPGTRRHPAGPAEERKLQRHRCRHQLSRNPRVLSVKGHFLGGGPSTAGGPWTPGAGDLEALRVCSRTPSTRASDCALAASAGLAGKAAGPPAPAPGRRSPGGPLGLVQRAQVLCRTWQRPWGSGRRPAEAGPPCRTRWRRARAGTRRTGGAGPGRRRPRPGSCRGGRWSWSGDRAGGRRTPRTSWNTTARSGTHWTTGASTGSTSSAA